MAFITNIKRQYKTTGGYLEFLKIAFPLIISTGSWAIQNFVNRTFLAWYSKDAFAASVPAGISNFAIMSMFIGTLTYVDVFVSQYYGKEEYRSIGPAVWQSVYLAAIAALIILFISFFSQNFFGFVGHDLSVMKEEIKFFKTLCYGAFPSLAAGALSGFYAGRGKTKVVLMINVFGISVNFILDYLLIFGKFGFPEMGIVGAAIASIIAATTMLIGFVVLVTSKKNNEIYNTRSFKPDFAFMKRLLRYGFPNGVQFFFDMAGFGIFILIIGTLGTNALVATNIALNVNHLIVMPLVGCGITTSIMVGHYLGKNKASLAQISVKSAIHIVYVYIIFVVGTLVFLPHILIYPFAGGAESVIIEQIKPVSIILLRFLALYAIFDAMNIIFSAAIKGAGDTAFVMKLLIILSIFIAIIPAYLIIIVFKLGLYAAWTSMLFYIMALAISFYIRYKSNKWKKMRVIEMNILDD